MSIYKLLLYLPEKSIYSNYQNQLYLTVWSSLPVAKIGFFGWTAKAHNSPSAWPWTTHRGLSRLFTWTSKISLSWVPISSWSPRQHTLRRHNPEGEKNQIRSNKVAVTHFIKRKYMHQKRKDCPAPPNTQYSGLFCIIQYSFTITNSNSLVWKFRRKSLKTGIKSDCMATIFQSLKILIFILDWCQDFVNLHP